MTAAGIKVRLLAGADPRSDKILKRGFGLCIWSPPEPTAVDMYYWWHASQVLPMMRGHSPKNWYRALRETALKLQKGDGSWPASGPWGAQGGENYSTAAMILALQGPYGAGRRP